MNINGSHGINFSSFALNSGKSADDSLGNRPKSISEMLSNSSSYQPDTTGLKSGQTLSGSNWTEEQQLAFSKLDIKDIYQSVDLTKTNRSELNAVLSALTDNDLIDEDTANGLKLVLTLDQNLNNDAEFNAMEYLDKSINGFNNDTPQVHKNIFSAASEAIISFHSGVIESNASDDSEINLYV